MVKEHGYYTDSICNVIQKECYFAHFDGRCRHQEGQKDCAIEYSDNENAIVMQVKDIEDNEQEIAFAEYLEWREKV